MIHFEKHISIFWSSELRKKGARLNAERSAFPDQQGDRIFWSLLTNRFVHTYSPFQEQDVQNDLKGTNSIRRWGKHKKLGTRVDRKSVVKLKTFQN